MPKSSQHTTSDPSMTTLPEVLHWYASLQHLHQRLAPHFARREPFQRTLRFLQAILSSVERKNGWQVAEQAREANPYGMQRLLSQATWDADGVRDEIRRLALQTLGTRQVIAAIDETSFLKRGKHSAGVAKQHHGLTDDVRNCQVGVFLSLITPVGHTLVDRELYLPREWTDDPARCRQAGIPDTVAFATKPQLAQTLLERLLQAQVDLDWVVADSVYGSNPSLRAFLESRQQSYVMAVTSQEAVVVELPALGVRRLVVSDLPILLQTAPWHMLALSEGTKGPRTFEWACLPVFHQGRDDGWHRLLIRRSRDPDPTCAFFLVFAPPTASLAEVVQALGARWRIEEDFAHAKDLGLDHYEVRSFVGWYRYITLVLLALAFLTSLVCAARASPADPAPASACCPLSVPETRRLLAHLCFPPPSSTPFLLHWSVWRRRHQHRASVFHIRRRLRTG
jgi:SRSO17 transposase